MVFKEFCQFFASFKVNNPIIELLHFQIFIVEQKMDEGLLIVPDENPQNNPTEKRNLLRTISSK
jgi:hypothetical protein